MKVCNFGSINVDYVYKVDTFVRPGETKSAEEVYINAGGKGLNQSVALSRAGLEVYHVCPFGKGGELLKETLEKYNVDTSYLIPCETNSGHAIIQVENSGQNSILLYGGSNREFTEELIDSTLEKIDSKVILLQNEINKIPYIIEKAKKEGFTIFFNAAPMNERVKNYPLEKLDWIVVNEVEGMEIAECKSEEDIVDTLSSKYPNLSVLLTLGKKGAVVSHKGKTYKSNSLHCPVIDTTAAGDTFIGFFISGLLKGLTIEDTLRLSTTASALTIGKLGASVSIPSIEEVKENSNSFGSVEVEEL